jgi:tRNA (cytidine/uridine-2'-O-)-methyltransferase
MFNIVLVEPEIPPNTGNVIRLAANTGCTLHLVEPLGFSMDDKHMRRAGLDYHEYADVLRHASWDAFTASEQPARERMFALTTQGTRAVHDAAFAPGDWLVFGSETRGLAPQLRESFAPAQRLRLPMRAVTVFEAWRQNGFALPPT